MTSISDPYLFNASHDFPLLRHTIVIDLENGEMKMEGKTAL